ncbi:hypothetical protein [Thermogemmata fonticola]|uniref:Tetratricopeptide repeat protein n=1 Tax=Thermogemmata fonticola TaxID=2755323 RepID=A0A7V9AAQ8_9BACT|nr:hypothetical protein [Thermogemmata fonticola]MBA2224977.1 hypothetical protein [Thermogemmata fonticola]
MTRPASHDGPPALTDLMVRFLAQRSDAASAAVELNGWEVEPYELATGYRIDPRAAWQAATCLLPAAPDLAPPPEWPALVQLPVALWAIPCAWGLFPQRLQQLPPLLAAAPLQRLLPASEPPALPGFAALRRWIAQHAAPAPLPAACARLLHDWTAAEQLLPPGEGNELAALHWLRGQHQRALELWDQIPERPHILFNRGMARLFFDQPREALPFLRQAAALWGPDHPWQPLAQLYAAVAQLRLAAA